MNWNNFSCKKTRVAKQLSAACECEMVDGFIATPWTHHAWNDNAITSIELSKGIRLMLYWVNDRCIPRWNKYMWWTYCSNIETVRFWECQLSNWTMWQSSFILLSRLCLAYPHILQHLYLHIATWVLYGLLIPESSLSTRHAITSRIEKIASQRDILSALHPKTRCVPGLHTASSSQCVCCTEVKKVFSGRKTCWWSTSSAKQCFQHGPESCFLMNHPGEPCPIRTLQTLVLAPSTVASSANENFGRIAPECDISQWKTNLLL